METCVNTDSKKTVLRMIPYGIYVLTADDANGNIAAATVNWVPQSAFAPPLMVVGVKADSGTYKTVKAAQVFVSNGVIAFVSSNQTYSSNWSGRTAWK